MIIDNHVHIAGSPHNDEMLGFPVYDGRTLPYFLPRSSSSPERLIEDMDKCGIDKAIVNALAGWATNIQVSETIKQYPDRLYGFAWVSNPLDNESSINELEYAVNDLGLHGLKLHPGLQGFSPADPKLVPLVEKAAELGAPIFFHMGAWPSGSFGYCLPENLDVLSHRVPNARIIIGHMGYLRFMDVLAILPYSDGEGGLFVDTSMALQALVEFYGLDFMTKYVRRIGVDKVLFGSDWSGDISRIKDENLDIIEKLGLTRDEKKMILGGNVSSLLKT